MVASIRYLVPLGVTVIGLGSIAGCSSSHSDRPETPRTSAAPAPVYAGAHSSAAKPAEGSTRGASEPSDGHGRAAAQRDGGDSKPIAAAKEPAADRPGAEQSVSSPQLRRSTDAKPSAIGADRSAAVPAAHDDSTTIPPAKSGLRGPAVSAAVVGDREPAAAPRPAPAAVQRSAPLAAPSPGSAAAPRELRPNPLRDDEASPLMRSEFRENETARGGNLAVPSQPVGASDRERVESSTHESAAIRPATSSAKPTKPKKKGKHGDAPFDPIEVNGKFFENWPKPRFALVITGRQDGYLEPCGCAGLDRMKGGLMRRHTFFEELRHERGWQVLGLDVGGPIKGFGRQTELKFQTTFSAMQKMGYDVIGFGEGELRLPTGELVSVAAGVDGKPSPFVSANVGLFGFASGLTGTKRILAAGERKIGVTAVLGTHYQKLLHNAEIEMAPPEPAIRKVLAELREQRCDLLVLLAYATMEETRQLAAEFPDFDVVVTSAGVGEPPDRPEKLGDKTLLIEVGEKGMGAVVLGYFDEPPRVRYQRVLLDSRYASSPTIKRLFAAYQDQLKDLGLEGLGVRVAAYPQREILGSFVGSAKCEPCHEESYRVWKKSGHAKAYASLVEADPPRNFDPECISCHVVGWHPTKYFPYQGGFLGKETTPHLTDVGCEACHGAGEAHCDAEIKNDADLQEKIRKAMVVTKAEAEKRFCAACHDLDNSPDFDFATYWPEIEHYEKE